MSEIIFVHPHTILDKVGEALEKFGAEGFFKSPNQEAKKAQEAFAAYFFSLAMKLYTGQDWWIRHPNQAERSYPDFDFMSFGDDLEHLRLESVELTGVYPHFKSFKEVLVVIENKKKKYGPKPVKFSLLIFVNHEKSEEWINFLRQVLRSASPFISIWTIHLKFKPGGKEVGKAVAQRILPLPGLRVETNTDDPIINKRQPLPNYMDEQEENGQTFVTINEARLKQFLSLKS